MSEVVEILALWPLWVLFVALAALGGFLVVRAVVAYRSRHSRPMLLLGLGLAVMAIGTPLAWTTMYFATGDLFWCTAISSGASLAGVSLLVASVEMRTS
ncbi:MAG: hypothetical protein KGJ23_03305 [Euryarchaeota archaeon]|nr:hypothetical protein [Euryarchaeota archaeon]MDE1835626.1 hypothetical protein [Euryarchaeota archaeon]MDE1878974.1 hypothetical protein [Euryarchaeota archaeon]MDE2043752.1 hypothetical protein [Thermoplasmata archaeon]